METNATMNANVGAEGTTTSSSTTADVMNALMGGDDVTQTATDTNPEEIMQNEDLQTEETSEEGGEEKLSLEELIEKLQNDPDFQMEFFNRLGVSPEEIEGDEQATAEDQQAMNDFFARVKQIWGFDLREALEMPPLDAMSKQTINSNPVLRWLTANVLHFQMMTGALTEQINQVMQMINGWAEVNEQMERIKSQYPELDIEEVVRVAETRFGGDMEKAAMYLEMQRLKKGGNQNAFIETKRGAGGNTQPKYTPEAKEVLDIFKNLTGS